MEITITKLLRKGKKSTRVLLSTGEEVKLNTTEEIVVGQVYAVVDGVSRSAEIRPLTPTDPVPSMLNL